MPLGWHLFAAIGARMAGVRKVVAHVGNFPKPSQRRSWWALSQRRSWWAFKTEVQLARPFTNALVCCSEYVREGAIKGFGLQPYETLVIPNGIDLESWASVAARRFVPTTGCLKLCMVGTLEEHKDHVTLIEAMPLLIERVAAFRMKVRLTLVGDGSRRAVLEDRVAQLGVKDAVRFLGTQGNIASILEETDIFVFSTTEHEGQGIALIEAMAAGLPIVASNVGACREVLRDGQCGFLVAPHNPLELTDAILHLARDQRLAQALSTAARARAQAEYSIVSTAERYAQICGVEWIST
jgi:glycosyltransferase involved in cell wall biosynthesis